MSCLNYCAVRVICEEVTCGTPYFLLHKETADANTSRVEKLLAVNAV